MHPHSTRRPFSVHSYRQTARVSRARVEAARAERKAIIAENLLAFCAGLAILAVVTFAYAAGLTWQSFQ